MDAREGMSSGVTVIGAEAPSAYHVAPRMENQSQGHESPVVAATQSPLDAELAATTVKKKRGRPRKYGPDGTVTMALSPMPISSSAPPSGDFSSRKRGKARSGGSEYKHHNRMGMEHFGGGSLQPMFSVSHFLANYDTYYKSLLSENGCQKIQDLI